ncbi:hypothetical protein GB937_002966 [Aspergillus fischeri]|nr:hypothetical protein GB937_002966 [Aspergillus fischeri]
MGSLTRVSFLRTYVFSYANDEWEEPTGVGCGDTEDPLVDDISQQRFRLRRGRESGECDPITANCWSQNGGSKCRRCGAK